MDTRSSYGQPGRAASGKTAAGRARVAGVDPSLQRRADPATDRWAMRVAVAGRNLTETYSGAIAAGIEPEELDFAFVRLAEIIAQAEARQYPARHARNSSRDDQPRLVIPDVPGSSWGPDPKETKTPAEFMDALRRYRLWAGNPSFRRMQRQCGDRFAASTICTALKGSELPSQDMTDAIVVGCGGRQEHREAFVEAWRRLTFSQHDGNEQPGQPAKARSLHSVI